MTTLSVYFHSNLKVVLTRIDRSWVLLCVDLLLFLSSQLATKGSDFYRYVSLGVFVYTFNWHIMFLVYFCFLMKFYKGYSYWVWHSPHTHHAFV